MGIFSRPNSGAKRRKVGRHLLLQERGRLRDLFGQSESLLLTSLEERRKGFEQAKSAALDQGRVARTRAIGAGQQAQAEANLSLAGTGRGGTSLVAPTSGGVSARIQSTLAEIDAQTSRLFGTLAVEAGQSEAEGFEQLAALQERLFQTEGRQYFDPLFNLFTGTSRRGDF